MSELLVDNLTGKTSAGDITVYGEGGTVTQSLQQGLAKAWVSFDGTGTIAARDSFNVSSLTDNGTGDHTITFSSAFANIYLALSGGGDHDGEIVSRRDSSYATTTTTERFCLATSGGSLVDRDRANILFHGDLA